MRWEGGGESGNVEDRRGISPGLAVGGGGGVLLLILGLIFGVNFQGGGGGGGGGLPLPGGGRQQAPADPNDKTAKFIRVVTKYTEDVWNKEFQKHGSRYQEPKLVIFSDAVRTGCGNAPSSVGPFYCPADRTVYLDPTFFDELERKLGGSKAEFSQAYVIAHEVGHHVQNLLGYSAKADSARGTNREKEYSTRLELQADYLAGVWAHHGQKQFKFIEPGDVESALTTAKAIGDDRLQKQSRGWASPESYTHGTSRQRMLFFKQGLETGDDSRKRLDRFFESRWNPKVGEIDDQ